jgi:L-arginine dehydrogenase
MKKLPLIADEARVRAALPSLDMQSALERMFLSLASARAVQPPQTLTLFPGDTGDFITYLGALTEERVFGAKLSPYIPTTAGPIITAWTALMSMEDGEPLMWCDSALLTIERTACTTALAVDYLAPRDARVLSIVGTGAVGQAHLKHIANLREWDVIKAFSPGLTANEELRRNIESLDKRVIACDSIEGCVAGADVVSLCTSSSKPVLPNHSLKRSALVTSISTNAINAHEVPPAWLPEMDVYCDYRATTPASAGEMKLAAAGYGWSPESIVGDLPELASGSAPRPKYERNVFFRSIGLGLEDIAVAAQLYQLLRATDVRIQAESHQRLNL